ncbi:hypothetical protein ZIOFF_026257 [Zingiber officinale]|uniref:DNA helicase n=1 Tax=Zingiber officinale TaxID=94328 RepID=A0A8J5LKC7_ZINOF|nr:hypothetical protein ZIOFF_026257 [Zingiber officinale]
MEGVAKRSGVKSPAMSVEQFVSLTSPLIDLEKEAEIAASIGSASSKGLDVAQKRGYALLNLKCTDAQTGLMGKALLEFQSNKGDLLPAHKFSNHDVVILKPNKADSGSPLLGQGVVYRLKDSSIIVAFDDIPEDGLNGSLRLEKVANEVTYRSMKDALIKLSKGTQKGPAADLIPVLFGEKPPVVSKKVSQFSPFNKNLDHSQRDAVLKSLSCRDVFLLHGPPGTGKTTTVIEIILQGVKQGAKVLACAASNIAVDNMVERLFPFRVKLVRLGHPARLLPQVLDSALDAQVLQGDNSALAKDIRKEMKVLSGKLLKAKDRNTKRDIKKELRTLAKEERKRQQLAVSDVIKNADVVLTTLTGSFSRKLESITFDLVIIDEAAQALEVACWIPLLKGPRCVLAGDHLQLPPTIQSVEAEKKGLGKTLFERLAGLYGDEVMSMLTVQYRMHELIMSWSSKEFYNSKVEAHSSVAGHMLYDLEGVKRSSAASPTLLLIDTTGQVLLEYYERGRGCGREKEAIVISMKAMLSEESRGRCDVIGWITWQIAQEDKISMMIDLTEKLYHMIRRTILLFVGRNKKILIVCWLLAHSTKKMWNSSQDRKLNVGVNFPNLMCNIVCRPCQLSTDLMLDRLLSPQFLHNKDLCTSGRCS